MIGERISRRSILKALLATGVAAAAGATIEQVAALAAEQRVVLPFLLCDGRAISRHVYPELYDLLGWQFGRGETDDLFRVPDLRARIVDYGPAGICTSAMTMHYWLVAKPRIRTKERFGAPMVTLDSLPTGYVFCAFGDANEMEGP